jgi:ubiquinone/menaquinone biosynthesis C-methylase UbiE
MEENSPAPIVASILGYFRTAAMLAATRLDLFSRIAEGHDTVAALAEACGAEERTIRALCDFLAVHHHLEHQNGTYRLTPASATFLDRRSPAYMGSMADFLASPANRDQAFSEALGAAARQTRKTAGNIQPENPVWVAYAKAMTPLSLPVAKAAAAALAPVVSGARRILDVAAGSGVFGIEMLKSLPLARVVAVDWPAVLEVAKTNAHRRGVGERLEILPGNALEIDLGAGYDLVMLPNFLHHFDEETNIALLVRARAALAAGGRLAVIEFVRDGEAVPPEPIATFALMMRATTPDGDAYSSPELERMIRAAGFGAVQSTPLGKTLQTLLLAS